MRNYVYAALLCGGLGQAAGCVIVDDGGPDDERRGQFDVLWTVDGFDDEFGDGCAELGAASVWIVSQPIAGGEAWTDEYECDRGGAVTATLPLGDYDVWAKALDADGRLLADSSIQSASLSADGEVIELDEFGFLNSHFTGSWAFVEARTLEPQTCSEVNAGGLSLLSTLANSGGTAFDDELPCPADDTTGPIESKPLPLGDYTVSVAVLESGSDGSLGEITEEGSLVDHAEPVDLGEFEFTFPLAESGTFDVIWKVNGVDDANGDGCAELGAANVEIVSESVTTDREFIDRFDCDAGGAVLPPLPLDDYDVYARALDEDGRLLGDSPVEETALDTDGETVELPEFAFENGAFRTTWLLTEENTNNALTCAEAGVSDISFLSTLANSGGTAFDQEFPCPSGDTTGDIVTDPLPLGDYTISVAVIEAGSDGSLGEITAEGSLVDHAVAVTLDPFEFFFPEA